MLSKASVSLSFRKYYVFHYMFTNKPAIDFFSLSLSLSLSLFFLFLFFFFFFYDAGKKPSIVFQAECPTPFHRPLHCFALRSSHSSTYGINGSSHTNPPQLFSYGRPRGCLKGDCNGTGSRDRKLLDRSFSLPDHVRKVTPGVAM